jgi:dTDP-4-dehydrorhamnose reductase
MKILVTGGRGMLGTDLCAVLRREQMVVPVGRAEMEITSRAAVEACVKRERPDWIVHCAAYTDVDGCERDPDRAFAVNATGTEHVAAAAAEHGSALIVISTDFVFNGEKREPYTENDTPHPINRYGASKLAGEERALRACPRTTIVRTQWLYGLHGNCFPETMLRAAASGRPLSVVHDQIGAPTFTRDLAAKIAQLVTAMERASPDQERLPQIIHINNAGACSWHEFAVAVLRGAGIDTPVTPIAARDWPSPARRPAYSVLGRCALQSMGSDDMRPWQAALAEYLSERQPVAGSR